MTINILEYIRKILNLKTLVRLYRRFFDRPNITYTVAPITSSGFQELNFLVPPKIGGIGNIEKTIIFIDGIEKSIALRKYLQSFLPNNLKDRSEKIIVSFSSILEAKTKTGCSKDFLNGNTRILICTDIA